MNGGMEEKMTAEELKLKKALDESLMKRIQQIPEKEALQEKHTFTESFRLFMAQLVREQETPQKNKAYKRSFYGFIKAAACIVCVIGLGTLAFDLLFQAKGGGMTGGGMNNSSDSAPAILESQDAEEQKVDTGTDTSGTDTNNYDRGEQEEPDKTVNEESLQQESSVLWEAASIEYRDHGYFIEFTLTNHTDREVTYGAIHEWTYKEETIAVCHDDMAYILSPGETVTETCHDITFSERMEFGEVLTAKRMIDGEEVSCVILLGDENPNFTGEE